MSWFSYSQQDSVPRDSDVPPCLRFSPGGDPSRRSGFGVMVCVVLFPMYCPGLFCVLPLVAFASLPFSFLRQEVGSWYLLSAF